MASTAELWDGLSAHEALACLRRQSPVHRVTLPNGMSAWLVTRYAEAREVLCDERFAITFTMAAHRDAVDPALLAAMNSHMIAARGADHTRLRRLVSAAFTRRRLDLLTPEIRRIVDELLDRLVGRDRVDLIAEYASPLPARVISTLVGIPSTDHQQFREWSQVILSSLGSPVFPVTEATAFVEYLRDLIAAKRATPDDTLLSALIAARDDGDRLSEDELTSTVFVLIVGGTDTTLNLIASGMRLLLADPARAESLRVHPENLPGAVEEILRYESPIPVPPMLVATQQVTIGDTVVSEGDRVIVSLLSANRDEAEFPDADCFLPDRDDGQHLAFGLGRHYCLGASLGRLEGQLAIEGLLRRYPRLRLAVPPDELRWRPGVFVRGLRELPVVLR
jgi:cytochrome P450